jgi:uncharacterized alkaline shock family protein YloU
MPSAPIAGKSLVTRRALVDIVTTAVQSSYGVTSFSDPNLGRRVLRWAGLDRPGIKMTTKDGLRLEVFLTVAFGVPVAEVARQVESAVRYSVKRSTGLEVTSLIVHVNGMRHEASAVQRAEEIERTVRAAEKPVAASSEVQPMAARRARKAAPATGSTTGKAAGATARRRTTAS